MNISNNIAEIKDKIAHAAHKSKRNPEEIQLVAVSKHFPLEKMQEAMGAGQYLFGENYIQELQNKKSLLLAGAIFHFIGHLQSNKAKIAAEICTVIETLDNYKLARTLNNHLEKLNKRIDVLIQVNIGNDPKKAGIAPDDARTLLIQLRDLPRIKASGLMTIPPYDADPERSRIHFSNLRILAKKLTAENLFPEQTKPELSMGMSGDYLIAIEEGATIIRVGTAIFGKRQ